MEAGRLEHALIYIGVSFGYLKGFFFLRMGGISKTRTISHYNTYSPTLWHILVPAVCNRTLTEGVDREISDESKRLKRTVPYRGKTSRGKKSRGKIKSGKNLVTFPRLIFLNLQ